MKRHTLQRHWLLAFILLLTIVSFLPTFTNGFQTGWDDQWMVINSQTVKPLNRFSLWDIFTVPSHGQLAPVNQIMYTLLYRGFRFNPTAYHIASLLIHLANITLLYIGLGMLLRDCTRIPVRRAAWLVAITTALFAVHPLQVESVAWISASKIPLSTLFYFAGAIMLMCFLRRGREGYAGWYAGALLMQLLSYLSKEQAVVFPLLAILLLLWYGVRLHERKFWLYLLPFCLLALACVVHEVFYVANYDQYIQGDTYAWWQRFFFSIYSVVTYFFKWLVPINLHWMYLFPIGKEDAMPWWLMLYPLFVVFLVYAFWGWIRRPLVLSLLAFFFIHLILVLHITVLPRASVVADRYMYISIISLNFMFAYIVTGITWLVRHPKFMGTVVAVVLAISVGTSLRRTMDWKDTHMLRSAISKKYGIDQAVTTVSSVKLEGTAAGLK